MRLSSYNMQESVALRLSMLAAAPITLLRNLSDTIVLFIVLNQKGWFTLGFELNLLPITHLFAPPSQAPYKCTLQYTPLKKIYNK